MRTEFQVGDRLELVIEKLPTYPGQTYICNGVEVPECILKASPRNISDFPLEVGDTVLIDGKPEGLVSKIDDNGNIHFIFSDGSVGVAPAGQELSYIPGDSSVNEILKRVESKTYEFAPETV